VSNWGSCWWWLDELTRLTEEVGGYDDEMLRGWHERHPAPNPNEKDDDMLADFADSKVTVKKDELLKAIRANRETHRDRFLKATTAYREVVIKTLDRTLVEVREGRPFLVNQIISLAMPTEHTKEYDTILRMLEMSVNDELVVSQKQFKQFVLDDWDWKGDFERVSSSYGC
jgi:hypothetical protein